MANELTPKTTYYAHRSALQLMLFLLGVVLTTAACIYDEALVSPLVPFGLVAIALLISEFERKGLLKPFARRTVCELGADGMRIGKRFIAWRDVRWAERDEGYAGSGENAEYNRRVSIGLRDGGTIYVEPFNPQSFVSEVLRRSKPKARVDDTVAEAYREASAPSREQLVRVAIDGSAEVQERIHALERLDVEARTRVGEAIVDARLQSEN
ncbi:MAG: hypothetical protein AB8H86_27225 [Polyangiales bacterium]